MSLFSRRTVREVKQAIDPYKYDELPEALKYQIIHICNGTAEKFPVVFFKGRDAFYGGVHQLLCRTLGMPHLFPRARSHEEAVWSYFLNENETAKCLDVVEAVFGFMVQLVRNDSYVNAGFGHDIRQAVDEMNKRFQEHAIGYEFREGKFIRISSNFIHTEAVAPAMTLLQEDYLAGANQEFNRAHEHYRHQRYPECLNECLKAFESTMKAICDKRGWEYSQNATASQLMEVCRQNNLFPAYMETSLSGLRSALMNVATVRNKLSGHGQGSQQIQVTEETAAYMLHSTAANILFLVAREKLLP
jgi:Domain of unknown function (DUF7014)/AbiJ N-terminal domain 4